MQLTRKLTDDIYYIGVNDRRIALFENVYPVPNGVSYNSYLIADQKTCLLDTVDHAGEKQFKQNLAYALGGRKLDYVVITHMEPDHSATLWEIIKDYPEATIVFNKKSEQMAKNYFDFDAKTICVEEGSTLPLGKHTLHFVMAPMVHWPEVMVAYDDYDKVLFSADAFGSFGAVSGNLFADGIKFKRDYTDEMRRYYTNIVGKYGVQVMATIKKAAALDIKMICPLHGLIWRDNFNYLIEKYSAWATYTPEVKGVLVVYASVYGNTENAAEIFAARLYEKGVKNIAVYDVSKTDNSYLIGEAFKYSHIAIASTTYNAGIFVKMEDFINDLTAHGLANRTFAIIENGTWAATAGKLIKDKLSTLKNANFAEGTVKITSSLKENSYENLLALADEVATSVTASDQEQTPTNELEQKIDKTAFFKFSYGLFVLTAFDGKHNGCIINTATQLTDNPKVITIAVNKANYTHNQILKTGKFCISVISESASFDLFKRFGFSSGKDNNKFEGFTDYAQNGDELRFVNKNVSAYISAKVIKSYDYGTHTLFVANVTEAKTLSDEKPMTYAFYFENVKPKPAVSEEKKTGWICKICGYVHEGEELPEDFICPLCKHGADDFEKIK